MDAPVQYMEELRGELSFYPTWLPSDPIELGSYGRFDRGRFVVDGRLATQGIEVIQYEQEYQEGFQRQRGVRIAARAAGAARSEVIDLGTGAELEFERKFAWAFAVQSIRAVAIRNIEAVKKAVLDARELKAWDDDWLVVTELREATGLRVLVARAKNVKARMLGKGTVDAAKVLLAADGHLEYQAEDVFVAQSAKPTTPLFALRKVQGYFSKELRATSSESGSEPGEFLLTAQESFNF
jgi:hypothetical protein